MLNAIPIIGWLLSFLFAFSLAVPFYFVWGALAPVYFYFLPACWLHIPFWHTVGLFMLVPMLKGIVWPNFAYPNINWKK